MNMNLNVKLLLISTILFFFQPLLALEVKPALKSPKNSKIKFQANNHSMDPKNNVIKLQGNVKFSYQQDGISANEALIDTHNKKVILEGHVIVSLQDGTRIEAQKITYFYETQLAHVIEGRVTQGSSIFTGKEIKKTGPLSYKIKNGYWTSCAHTPDCSPEWSIWALRTDATIEKYGIVYSPIFFIKGLPVFWLPFLIMPIKRERQSGFLFPQPSFSEEHGWSLKNQFFWAMSPHQDSTFMHQYFEKRGHKYGMEYRFIPTLSFQGDVQTSYIQDEKFKENFSKKDRTGALYKHSWDVSENFFHRFRTSWSSDDEYAQDFPKDLPGREGAAAESNLLVGWHTPYTSLSTEGVYYEDLLSQDPFGTNKNSTHKMPEVRFSLSPTAFIPSLPVFFSVEGSYADFRNLGRNDYVDKNNDGIFTIGQDTLLKAHRFDFFPRLILPLNLAGFEVVPELSFRETSYYRNADKKWDERRLATLKGNVFYNILRDFSSIKKLKDGSEIRGYRHSIEPRMEYSYVPEIANAGLPSFDGIDEVTDIHEFKYFLSSWVYQKKISVDEKTKKEKVEFPQILEFRLFQTADFKKMLRKERKFLSNLTNKLSATWNPIVVGYELQLDTHDWFVDSFTSSFGISDPWSNGYSVSYNFKHGDPSSQNVVFGLGIGFIPWLNIGTKLNYSLEDGKFLERKAGIAIVPPSGCWTAGLGFEKSVDQDLLITANFSIIFGPEYNIPLVNFQEQSGIIDYDILPGGSKSMDDFKKGYIYPVK